MQSSANVVIVGAGPYGLSLAAHLNAAGVDYRIFGKPMHFWKEHVVPGMFLKSLGSSANLFDPAASFTVADYYAEQRHPYAEASPIPVDRFIDYGCAFQQRIVGDVDQRNVASIARDGDGFSVRLDDGDAVRTERVVIATGIRAFTHVPEALAALPPECVSHSADYGALDALQGRTVVVLGSGASAIDLAAALYERQIDVSLLCRQSSVRFQSAPGPRKFHHTLRSPDSPLGGGWDLWFYANAPGLFHLLPERTRLGLVATSLGPSPGWFMTERVLGRIPIVAGRRVEHAEMAKGQVRLTIASADGARAEVAADHIVAATGFRIDIDRLRFLQPSLKKEIALAGGAPVLSGTFETSAKGVYVIGAAAAASFGPVMRFVAGAGYTVRRVAAALARSAAVARRSPQMLAEV